MAANPHKRQRASLLQNLLHTGEVTTKALASIISKIREHPEYLQLSTQYALTEANLASFMQVRHVEPLALRDGTIFNWEFCEPNRTLALMVHECPLLEAIFVSAANKHPCSASRPWSLIIGFDEFTPGNQLSVHNERKCMNLSFNFVELGQENLMHEVTWMTPICVRHNVIAKVKGGWSHMFGKYLRLHLLGSNGLGSAGIPLILAGQPFLLFAKLKHIIGDGDGWRLLSDWKGACSLKPCFKHSNVVSKGSDLASRDGSFVEITCSDHRRFHTAAAADITEAVDVLLEARRRVHAGTITKGRFLDLQKVYGLNCSPEGVLADVELRQQFDVVSVTTYDWVHSAMQDGTMTTETFLFICACEEAGVAKMSDLVIYLKSDWQFPAAFRGKGRLLFHVFEECRSPSREKLKCTCSEMLGVYGLLRHFLQTRIGNRREVAAHRASFDAACRVLDVIQSAKRGAIPMQQAAGLLRASLADHMVKHLAVYGDSHIKPKHHWLFDVAEQFETHPFVIDAFIVERLHLRVKAIASHVKCTTAFERSVLAGVLTSQKRLLHSMNIADGLQGKQAQLPHSTALVSDSLKFKGLKISVEDIVYHSTDEAGKIIACVMEGDELFAVVERIAFVENVSLQSAKYKCTDIRTTWRVESLQLAFAWYVDLDVMVVLRA